MRRKRLTYLFHLILLSALVTGPVWAGQVVTDDARSWAKKALEQEKALEAVPAPNTVAVLYFYNLTKRLELDPVQKGLAIMLITDLSKVKSLNLVERIRLQALTEEMKLGVSGLVEENTAPRVGKLLGARWLVGGKMSSGQVDSFQINSDVLDVPTPRVAGQPGTQGMLDELFRMEKDLLFEIIKYLNIKPTPEEEVELKKPFTINVSCFKEFCKGIEMSDRRDYKGAAKFYENALKCDPNFSHAREALDELRSLGLIGKENRSVELLRSLRDGTSFTNTLAPDQPVKRAITPGDTITIQGNEPGYPEPPNPNRRNK